MDSNPNINTTEKICDINNKTIDKIITNIVRQINYDLKYVDYNSINPHTKYYVSDMYSITDFVFEEYYDYLLNIPDCAWTTYRDQIIKCFQDLKISSGHVLKLFVEKLGLPLEQLFKIVKSTSAINHELLLCCTFNYTDDFIKSIEFNDRYFFDHVLRYYDLKTNIFIYHNVYCKTQCFETQCIYRKFFQYNLFGYDESSAIHAIYYFDVFEYFVNLFGLGIQTNKLYTKNYHMLRLFVTQCFWNKVTFEEKPETAINLLDRMVVLSGLTVIYIKNQLCELIDCFYGGNTFAVGLSNNRNWWASLAYQGHLNVSIELFKYANIDLKIFRPIVIVRMLIELAFLNNLYFVNIFMCYLKYDVKYKIDVEFYSLLFRLLSRKNSCYKYLHVQSRVLRFDTLKELYEMKYLDVDVNAPVLKNV